MTLTKTNTGYSNKEIWQIAYPILISLIMEQLIGITDTAFLGRVGEVELGASAIAGVYYLAIFMIGFGFTIGSQILIARRNGEKNYTAIGPIFYQGCYFLLLLAAVTFTTQTKTLTLNSIVMVLSNVVFNYTLIFGKFGFPPMGIAGAAIGSSLAELVSLLFFIGYTFTRIDYRKYRLNRIPTVRFGELKQIMRISLWTMIQNFISLSTWFLFFIFIEHLGERPLAISNIIRSVSSIPFMAVIAFASTCGSLVSNQIGAGNAGVVQALIRQHIRICTYVVAPLIILIALFPRPVLHIYTDLPDLITAAIPTLWVLCSTYLVTIPGNIYFQSVSGTGNTQAAFLLELGALALYLVYIGVVILGFRADVAFCWTAEHVYAICIWVASYYYIRKGSWMQKKI